MSYEIPERRKVAVENLRGGSLWVWELSFDELTKLARLATRPAIDPRGGVDEEEAMLWKIALSCYDGEEETAARVFPDARVHQIRRIPEGDLDRINAAMNAVNSEGAREELRLRDFTPPGPEPNGSPSSSGVSSTWAGSPVS